MASAKPRPAPVLGTKRHCQGGVSLGPQRRAAGKQREALRVQFLVEEGRLPAGQEGRNHKERPQAIHHARYGGKQLDQVADGIRQPPGRILRHKKGTGDSQRNADHQSSQAGHQRSNDHGSSPKAALHRIPGTLCKKTASQKPAAPATHHVPVGRHSAQTPAQSPRRAPRSAFETRGHPHWKGRGGRRGDGQVYSCHDLTAAIAPVHRRHVRHRSAAPPPGLFGERQRTRERPPTGEPPR